MRPLPVPPAGPLDGGTVTFDAVSANHAYLAMRYTLTGVTPPPGLPVGKGGSPAVVVYGPDGRRIAMLSWATSSGSPTTFLDGPARRQPGHVPHRVHRRQGHAAAGAHRRGPNGRSPIVPTVPTEP
jgi:hypothetical protein